MAQATIQQFQTAIDNYLRVTALHRSIAASIITPSWKREADLRVAAKAESSAGDLAYQQGQMAYEEDLQIGDNPHHNPVVRDRWNDGYDYANSFKYF